jgi:valyl-tRNA synthetase
MDAKYAPQAIEAKWYAYWQQNGYFRSTPDEREPYTIVIPPPNVTGVLHMGHMLNNTIQDVLIRRARMQGKNALWVPGTDHASIATEAKVVQMLRKQGIKKADLSRDKFLEYAWEWKEKYGGIILEQLKKLGASCDWERTSFTMDDTYYRAVIRVFVDLYRKGHIYRGLRMVNWDCEALTTVSNEEVLYAEGGEQSLLYHIRYKIEGDNDEWITIATQRPETIMGDVAVAVNPNDERYKHLLGKYAFVPLINRRIPIIADEYVELEFGTGCLKVTPAHDINDYEIGLRHHLQVIDTISLDGTLNALCEIPDYVGKDRFWVRTDIIDRLKESGNWVKSEEFITRIGRSERTNSIVEPKLSLQWFIAMKKLCEPALENVLNDNIRLYPDKFKNTYRHWMENVRDWCISRQLWWGHRIPAYFYGTGENDFVVAETADEALALAQQASNNPHLTAADLRQDEDVLDTWASSWLWPIAVFDGFENYTPANTAEEHKRLIAANKELAYYYPTAVLVTAPEILFFWVARMIIAGYEYMGELPFKDVYLTGIVRDKLGRKMSKSLGNSPDPLSLIEQYSADGVRVGVLISSPAGNDLPFDEKQCEQGRNFCNKLWNAARLVKGWEVKPDTQNEATLPAIAWFDNKLKQTIADMELQISEYRLSEALKTIYSFVWDDFCSAYLELVKPDYEQPIDSHTYGKTIAFFEDLLKLLHPFMPFITEELYHLLGNRADSDCIMTASYPTSGEVDKKAIAQGDAALELMSKLRDLRVKTNIKPRDPLAIHAKVADVSLYSSFSPLLQKKAFMSELVFTHTEPQGASAMLVGNDTFYVITGDRINADEERARLQKELDYNIGFRQITLTKLNNEKFVSSAPPALVEKERQKLADAEAKIKQMEESLARLG